MSSRATAEGWFRQTLDLVSPRRLVRQAIHGRGGFRDWASYDRIAVVALGKAAAPMLAGWCDAATAAGAAPLNLRAVLSAPAADPVQALPPPALALPAEVFIAGHPDPNDDSRRAAEAMLAAARWAGQGTPGLLIALISGGGSALAELPRHGDLKSWSRLNRALVTSGAPIGEINLVRKHLSAFKGGNLARAAAGADQWTLVLSDVPGGDLSAVASGPTCPDPGTRDDARAALRRWAPADLVRAFEPWLEETPKPGTPPFASAHFDLLADNNDACATLATLARSAGRSPVVVDHSVDEATAEQAAVHLAARWRELRRRHPAPCLIAGGEVRVRVPAHARGRGGRNTELALRIAAQLEGESFCFLSAGTDGVDGVSGAAGAAVDGSTLARSRALGLDPDQALRSFDSATLLAATGDLIVTGPSGNNLRDLRLFL